jgi:hypothetical protein
MVSELCRHAGLIPDYDLNHFDPLHIIRDIERPWSLDIDRNQYITLAFPA